MNVIDAIEFKLRSPIHWFGPSIVGIIQRLLECSSLVEVRDHANEFGIINSTRSSSNYFNVKIKKKYLYILFFLPIFYFYIIYIFFKLIFF